LTKITEFSAASCAEAALGFGDAMMVVIASIDAKPTEENNLDKFMLLSRFNLIPDPTIVITRVTRESPDVFSGNVLTSNARSQTWFLPRYLCIGNLVSA